MYKFLMIQLLTYLTERSFFENKADFTLSQLQDVRYLFPAIIWSSHTKTHEFNNLCKTMMR